jgi:CRP-like cAMP-binding protein
MESASLIFWFS